MARRRFREEGFALPSIIISALVMFTVLVGLIGNISSTKVALDAQFYRSLARDAAESGWTHAEACLEQSGYLNTWDGSQLRPETDCNGDVVGGQQTHLTQTPRYRSAYTVVSTTDPTTKAVDSTIVGTVELLRASNGSVWKTFTHNNRISSTRKVTNQSVVFGYTASPQAVFYSILGSDGILRSAGANTYGQLGDGTLNDAAEPIAYGSPAGVTLIAAYANFLSLGTTLFSIDTDGDAYAAGRNNSGKAGVGSADANILIPQRVQMPLGEKVNHIVYGNANSYFIADSGNVYVAGSCGSSLQGVGVTCTATNVPVRVALPTPNPSDPNTMPTKNMVIDGGTAYIRMAGGRVYGWGEGYLGQLAQGPTNRNTLSSPTQISTYGNSGQPSAVDIVTDGGNIYILDNGGQLKSAGGNEYGQLGTNKGEILNVQRRVCLNASTDLVTVNLASCNGTGNQQWEHRSDLTLYNQTTNKCITVQADNISIAQANCTTANTQKFDFVYSRMYRNVQTNSCLNNTGSDSVSMEVNATCNTTTMPGEQFALSSSNLVTYTASGMTGSVKAVTTDQWSVSVLTTTGEVWSSGLNTAGQFGNGVQSLTQYQPVRFPLPTGVTGVSLIATNAFAPASYGTQNLYVIGSDGKVYGAGGNTYGQLGNGNIATQTTPVAMQVIDGASVTAKSIQAGLGTAVIFTTDNRVFAVGNNRNGQLGNSDVTSQYSSIPVPNKFVDRYIFNQY